MSFSAHLLAESKILHSKLSWWNLTRHHAFHLLPRTENLKTLIETTQHHFPGVLLLWPPPSPLFPFTKREREREINKCWVDTIRRRRIILKISAANLVNYEGFLVDSKQREEEEVLWRSLNTNPISKYGKNKVQKKTIIM